MCKKIVKIIIFLVLVTGVQACIENSAPVADAGPDRTVYMSLSDVSANNSTRVEISGEGSFDPNGDTLMFHWVLESIPAGSEVMLESLHAEVTVLEVDVEGTYEVSLIVDDGEQRSQKDTVFIHYVGDVNRPPLPVPPFPPGNGKHPLLTEQCVNCHNNVDAAGKSATHIATTDECINCHMLESWWPVNAVFHGSVLGTCASCHNGVLASGKSATHILSSDTCEECHSTIMWVHNFEHNLDPSVSFDHKNITGQCAECHNGLIAVGKSPSHIYSSNVCDACHSIQSFVPVSVDHSQVIGLCLDCHNGTVAVGKTASHIASDDMCDACHSVNAFIPVIQVNHLDVIGSCASCHDGIAAIGMVTTHPSTSNICEACHSTEIWQPAIHVDHNEVISNCVDCHAFPSSHEIIADSDIACDECHSTSNWQHPVSPIPANGI